MATELQIKKFKENPDCVELATIMASVIYPKILLLLSQLGMNEVRIEKIPGFKDFCITLDSKIEFYKLTIEDKEERKTDIFTIDFSNKNICPYYQRDSNAANINESVTERYIVFCTAVMNAIAPLELRVVKIKEFLNIANSFTLPLTRIVLIEKYHGEKSIK